MPETLEIVDLESLLEDEPPCMSKHSKTTCTIHVTYFIKSCGNAGLVCAAHVEDPNHGLIAKAVRGLRCVGCLQPASECWDWVLI